MSQIHRINVFSKCRRTKLKHPMLMGTATSKASEPEIKSCKAVQIFYKISNFHQNVQQNANKVKMNGRNLVILFMYG